VRTRAFSRYARGIQHFRLSGLTRLFVLAAVVAAAAVLSWRAAVPAILRAHMRLLSNRLRFAADDPRVLSARLTLPGRTIGGDLAMRLWPAKQRSERLALAATLIELAAETDADTAARANGVANVVAGHFELARTNFEAIRQRSAADWNDLAVAHISIALQDDDPDQWLSALAAVDHSLATDPALLEARFNRALIIEAMGVTPVARAQWTRYRTVDPDSRWSLIVQQRLASFTASDAESWNRATAQIDTLSLDALSRLADRYPQTARRFADALFLSSWATSAAKGDARSARQHLDRVRAIARTLNRRGEPLLLDAVAAIERAASSPHILSTLIRAQIAYFHGRLALRDGNPVAAEPELRTAAILFQRSGSPMAGVAEFWVASVLSEQNRADEARGLLESLLSRETAAGGRYRALIGHIQYQLSLLEAMRGDWTASLAAAQDAKAIFERLGERGNLANANALFSENYDLLGRPELAWKHGLAAVRDSAADGALDRTRVSLAVLCRTELRGRRWDRAQSLARLEGALAPLVRDVRLDPDMFIRRAAGEWHQSNDDAAAARWLQLAGDAADRITDPAMRAKLLADVSAAHGLFVRRSDARAAIRFLSAAILFQMRTGRPILLPELYLERGRAFLLAEDLRSAEVDFEAGLSELERQRSHVHDAELRPGLFDDASELFDEAIALQIRQGATVDRVLHEVERGRARAVFEQISANDDSIVRPHLPTVAEVQRALSSGTALLEYVSLPDRLIAVVLSRERAVMRTIPVSRDALTNTARALTDSRGAGGEALYDALIAPLQNELHGISAITIVADDTLQRVPFAALFDRRTRTFLVQQYVLATSPSAGVLLATLAHRGRLRPLQRPTALIFANPAVPEQFGNLPSLNAAESEAKAVARSYQRADVFTRDAATAARFLALAPSRDFVHYGGHAVINDREPFASALVCASGPGHAGGVTSREIARMNFLSTRAIVLAACSTMTGRNAAIEGVPSLSRAFVVAGVPAVIGTLWDIDDSEAVAVTHPLHQLLGRGVPPAEALRRAQIAAIRKGLPVSQWSAFALMGSS